MAATRFYFSSTVPAGVAPNTIDANWNHAGNTPSVLALNDTVANSALTDFARAPDTLDDPGDKNVLVGQFVSRPLAAQSIPSQVVQLCVRGSEQRSNNNLVLAWRVYLITSAGSPRAGGTIVPFQRDGVEFIQAVLTSRIDSPALNSQLVNAQLNDRICIEIGFGGNVTPGTASVEGHNGTLNFGDLTSASDLAGNDVETVANRPWLNFAASGGIIFAPASTPTTRITQDSVECLYDESIASTPETRVTQDSIEVLQSGTRETRVSQDALEVLYDESINSVPETRVTQDSAEVLWSGASETRVTQDALECLYDEIVASVPKTYVTQDSIEVLWEEPPPPEVETIVGCPLGQISRVHAEQGQITHVQATFGQVSRVHAEDGQINCD